MSSKLKRIEEVNMEIVGLKREVRKIRGVIRNSKNKDSDKERIIQATKDYRERVESIRIKQKEIESLRVDVRVENQLLREEIKRLNIIIQEKNSEIDYLKHSKYV